jgi:hypothetical protein
VSFDDPHCIIVCEGASEVLINSTKEFTTFDIFPKKAQERFFQSLVGINQGSLERVVINTGATKILVHI